MAKDLNTIDTAKPRKKRGPTVKKPKEAYLMFEGEAPANMAVVFDARDVLTAMDSNPNLKRVKFVIPVKAVKKADPAPAAA